eukprot:m.463747 g.463747  ORF g.463747 m.463747 type:complete len:172 (+) comp23149_c0_seq1:160-675(+)
MGEIAETDRLRLRELTLGDAEFTLELYNDPDFHKFIGDKGIRTLEDARRYLEAGAIASYKASGYGLWMVVEKTTGAASGICGLVKRDGVDFVELGFAFLPAYRRKGYATEACHAVMARARDHHGLARIAGITAPTNAASKALLAKMGLQFERVLTLPGFDEPIELHITPPE